MALIKCPECGEMISDKAIACIKCGYPIRELGISNDNTNEKKNDHPQAIETTGITESKRIDEEKSKAADSQKINKDRLLEYLRHAIKLEGNALGEQNVIDNYVSVSEKNKPQIINEPEPIAPTIVPVPAKTKDDYAGIGLIIGGYIFGIICLVLGVTMPFALCVIIGLGVLGFAIYLTVAYSKQEKGYKETANLNASRQSDYRRKCLEIQEKNRIHAKEYEEDMRAWRINVDSNLDYLKGKRGETLKVLDEYYQPNIIFPKYHTLPALTSIYEYISSGRCDDLTGPNGAYNLYEAELRQNTIIEKLNVIIDNLEQIRKNQYALYQELSKINATTRQISYEMSAIRGYTQTLTSLTALNTYYNAITADNTAALTFLTILG